MRSKRKVTPIPYQPFIFVLKEGQKIQDNPMDYSLMLMQTGRPEIIKKQAMPCKKGLSSLQSRTTND